MNWFLCLSEVIELQAQDLKNYVIPYVFPKHPFNLLSDRHSELVSESKKLYGEMLNQVQHDVIVLKPNSYLEKSYSFLKRNTKIDIKKYNKS